MTSPTLAYLGELSFWDNPVVAFFLKPNKQQERIARIEISPNGATIREGEQINFTAVGYDARGRMIQGVKFNWTATSQTGKSPVLPLTAGRFEPQFFGDWAITAEVGGVKSQVIIKVKRDDVAVYGKELRQKKAENDQGKKLSNGVSRPTKIDKNQQLPPAIEVSTKTDSLQIARSKNENSKEQKRNLPQPDGKNVVGLKVNCSPDDPNYPDCGYLESDETKKVASVQVTNDNPTDSTTTDDESPQIEETSQTAENQSVFHKVKYSETGNKAKTKAAKKGKSIKIDLQAEVDPNCPAGYASLGGGMLGAPTTGVLAGIGYLCL